MKRTLLFSFVSLFAVLIAVSMVPRVSAIDVTTCGTLSSAGSSYILQNSLTITLGSCITINAADISFNGNGHTITSSGGTGANPIQISSTGVFLSNVNLITSGAVLSSTEGLSLLNGAGNLNISNVNISNFPYLVFLHTSAADNVLIKNSGFSNGGVVGNIGAGAADRYIINSSRFRNVTFSASTGQTFTNWLLYGNLFNSSDTWTNFPGKVTNFSFNNSVGGNFWANAFGNGFSQVCTDANVDGICDGTNTIFSGGVDYLPLRNYSFGGVNVSNVSGNEPPSIQAKFMGLDTTGHFVFRLGMSDNEGGNVFDATRFGTLGSYSNSTSVNFETYFTSPADLARVTNVFTGLNDSAIRLTTGDAVYSAGILINNSADVFPSRVRFPVVAAVDVAGTFLFSTSFQFNYPGGFPSPISRSVELYSSSNVFIGQLLFDVTMQNVTIRQPNGSVIYFLNTSDIVRRYYLNARIDFAAHTVNFQLSNIFSFTPYLDNNQTFSSSVTDFEFMNLNEYSTDALTYLGRSSELYTRVVAFPPYTFFDTLPASNVSFSTLWHDLRIPVGNNSFGEYEMYAWGTDDAHGLNYYVDPDYETFIYNSATPVLSEAAIAAEIAARNAPDGGFVLGDLATDKLKSLWEAIGFKSAGSKMLLGFILLALLAWALSGLGSEVIILIEVVGLIAMAYLGLFPIWLVIVVAIIAAALGAMALRKATTGH